MLFMFYVIACKILVLVFFRFFFGFLTFSPGFFFSFVSFVFIVYGLTSLNSSKIAIFFGRYSNQLARRLAFQSIPRALIRFAISPNDWAIRNEIARIHRDDAIKVNNNRNRFTPAGELNRRSKVGDEKPQQPIQQCECMRNSDHS